MAQPAAADQPPRWQEVDPAIDDICRVCRGEGSVDHPLFHPCICSGSIRYVHEDCLMQWLNHSNRLYCELCQHRFTFKPIYAPDTPSRLPPYVLLRGLRQRIVRAVKKLVHALLVMIIWLYILPNYCARVKNLMFAEEGYFVAILRFVWIGLSPSPATDLGEGMIIMALTMAVLFSFVFLRDEILHNAWNPPWLVLPNAANVQPPNAAPEVQPAEGPGNEDGNAAPDVNEDADQANAANGDANGDLANAFGEDMALGHIVGLDGTYAFVEYAFWFSVLCGGFVALCFLLPHTCGKVVVHNLIPAVIALGTKVLNVAPLSANLTLTFTSAKKMSYDMVEASQFKTALYLYFGYVAFSICFSHLYEFVGRGYTWMQSVVYLRRLNHPGIKFMLGLFFLGTKTGVLFFTEAVIFPATFGGLADFSCMDVFNATLQDRMRNFEAAPGTFIFLHWILGVLFISYFVWFVLLTRETLRPGLLWFVRSYQESNPFKELVMWPIGKSLKNLTFVLLLFIVVISVTIFIPVKLLCHYLRGVFPYNLQLLEESPIGELTIQFAVLHYIGPSLFQQTTLKSFIKWLILSWAQLVGELLDIRSYLLGDQQPAAPAPQPNPVNPNDGNLGQAHDQLDLMLVNAPNRPTQPYTRPSFFPAKLVMLLVFLAATGIFISGMTLTLPVLIGRLVLGFWFGSRQVHDIYTLFTGIFTLAVILKGGRVASRSIRSLGRLRNVKFGIWTVAVGKTLVAALMVLVWLPMLVGVTFEVTFLKPIALFFDQSSIFQVYRCYVFGALIVKIVLTFCIVAVGENNRVRLALDQVYANGFRNMNLTLIWNTFVWPMTAPLLFYLAFPFFAARTFNLIRNAPEDDIDSAFNAHITEGVAHISFLLALVVGLILLASMGYFKELHDQIRDELFLVGRRLVNYDHRQVSIHTLPPAAADPVADLPVVAPDPALL